jgi:hypothetical protein
MGCPWLIFWLAFLLVVIYAVMTGQWILAFILVAAYAIVASID